MHRERLIKSCTQLVVFIAKKHWKGGGIQRFLDLIEDGNIGLMRAVDKFSPAFKVKLATYAFWWIKESIGRGKENTSRLVRVPVHIQQTASKLVKFRQRFFDRNRLYPTNEEIAKHFSVTIEAIESAIQCLQGEARLDKSVGESADTSFGDLLEDTHAPDPTEGASISEMRQAIIAFLSTLPRGDREKMIRYYGLGLIEELRADPKDPIRYRFDKHEYGRNMTLEELGDDVGLTRERIRQVNDRSINNLKTVTHPAHDALEHHHRNLTSHDHTTYEGKPDVYKDLININPAISQLPIAKFDMPARNILQLADESVFFIGDLVRAILANAKWWQLTERQHVFRRNCFSALESVGITSAILGLPPEDERVFTPPSSAQSTVTDDF
jgi:RNA polymerase sigma factor (sigma-70 family)